MALQGVGPIMPTLSKASLIEGRLEGLRGHLLKAQKTSKNAPKMLGFEAKK